MGYRDSHKAAKGVSVAEIGQDGTTDEGPTVESVAPETTKSAQPRRERSTIAFPYDDLDAAVTIAAEVHNVHGGTATMAELAASLGQTTKSGAFRIKVSAARLFGLLASSQGTLSLTDHGQRVLDPTTAPQAKVDAFLKVPLYAALYDRFKDGTLPDDTGLEAAIRDLGVTPKQVQTARQVFQRSALQAGFFRFGNRKLVRPSLTTVGGQQEDVDAGHETEGHNGGKSVEGGSLDDLVRHPFILGLLRELPEPSAGFPAEARSTWLDAAKISFDLIYGKAQQHRGDERSS